MGTGTGRRFALVIALALTGFFAVTSTAAAGLSVSCATAGVAAGTATTCTARTSDGDGGQPNTTNAVDPIGTVDFASAGGGTFSPSSCTLVGEFMSFTNDPMQPTGFSNCSVSYTPPAYPDTVTATEDVTGPDSPCSDSAPCTGSATTTVSSLSAECRPAAVLAGNVITCTASTADGVVPGGGPPSGTISFTTDGAGTFSNGSVFQGKTGSCTLINGLCSVTYATAGVQLGNTITATQDVTGAPPSSVVTSIFVATGMKVHCDATVQLGSGGTCTATTTDGGEPGTSGPGGTVSFDAGSAGTFSPSQCDLTNSDIAAGAASCSVTYVPAAGSAPRTDTITATEDAGGFDEGFGGCPESGCTGAATTQVDVTTTVSVSCSPTSIATGGSVTCDAQTSDGGGLQMDDPVGGMSFSSSGDGTFDHGSCTLVGDVLPPNSSTGMAGGPTGTSRCSVTYTTNSPGTDRITATEDVTNGFCFSNPCTGSGFTDVTVNAIATKPAPDTDLAIAKGSDVTKVATSAAGASVGFSAPSASDEGGESPSVSCDPASGSTFAVGATTVTCTATDSDDTPSSATSTFTVTVTDGDLALHGVPSPITVNATGPSGAPVSYGAPTASDEGGQTPAVVCDHPSGSTFAIGTTTVTCSATASDGDDSQSPVSATFAVTVMGADAQLGDLVSESTGVGPGTSLADKARQAQSQLAAGDKTDACGTLGAFINQVKAQSGKSIPSATAGQLIADAKRIRAVIGC